jgi:hypothetical protein
MGMPKKKMMHSFFFFFFFIKEKKDAYFNSKISFSKSNPRTSAKDSDLPN